MRKSENTKTRMHNILNKSVSRIWIRIRVKVRSNAVDIEPVSGKIAGTLFCQLTAMQAILPFFIGTIDRHLFGSYIF